GSFLQAVLPDATASALLANGAWRMLFLLGAMPAFLTLFIRMFVPESEAWHAAVQTKGATPRVRDRFGGSLLRRTLVASALGGAAGRLGLGAADPLVARQALGRAQGGARGAADMVGGGRDPVLEFGGARGRDAQPPPDRLAAPPQHAGGLREPLPRAQELRRG